MGTFIRPSISSNKIGWERYVGEAQRFLQQTVNWERNKVYKHYEVLSDGTKITVIRLYTGQYKIHIDPKPFGEDVIPLFLLELSEVIFPTEPTDLSNKGQGIQINSDFNFLSVNTVNTTGTSTHFAGNVDWRSGTRLISWSGYHSRYNRIGGYYAEDFSDFNENFDVFQMDGYSRDRDSVIFNVATPNGPTANRNVSFEHPNRYSTFIYEDGKVIADTSVVSGDFLGTPVIVGAGVDSGTGILVVVKAIENLNVFRLYRTNSTGDPWDFLGEMDFSDSGIVAPEFSGGFFFNQSGTKMLTYMNRYNTSSELDMAVSSTVSNLTGAGSFVGTIFPLLPQESLFEIELSESGGVVTGVNTINLLNSVDYSYSLTSPTFGTVVIRDQESKYIGWDYDLDTNSPAYLISDLTLVSGKLLEKFTFKGKSIDTPSFTNINNTTVFLPSYCDIRNDMFIYRFSEGLNGLGAVQNALYYLVTIDSNDLVQEEIIFRLDSPTDPQTTTIGGPHDRHAPTATIPTNVYHSLSYIQAAVGRDKSIIVQARTLDPLTNLWVVSVYSTISSEILSKFYQRIDPDGLITRQVLHAQYQWTASLVRGSLHNTPDLGICAL